MTECDRKRAIHAANFIWSIYLLIMLDTLLLRLSLHFTQLHFNPLHYTCRHFTSSPLNFTQIHFATLSFDLTPFISPTAPSHLTSLHFTSLHFAALLDDLLFVNAKLYCILDKINELTHEKVKYLFSELQYRSWKLLREYKHNDACTDHLKHYKTEKFLTVAIRPTVSMPWSYRNPRDNYTNEMTALYVYRKLLHIRKHISKGT